MNGAGNRAGRGRRDQIAGFHLDWRMEAIMRMRRTILAPLILTLGVLGSGTGGAALAAHASAGTAAAAVVRPNLMPYHT
jgi:hypothetical protein